MDDLTMMREIWETPEPPSREAYFQARNALTNHKKKRRAGVRVLAVGALAVALAAGITVAQSLGGKDGPKAVIPGIPAGPVANAAQALDRAATAAAKRPFTPPRPDQWIFTEARNTSPAHGGGAATGGPLKTHMVPMWRKADGKKSAYLEKGKLVVQTEPGVLSPPADYPTLSTMPTDPNAMLHWVWRQMGGLADGTRKQRYALAYDTLTTILRDNVLPPTQEAAIYRTLKTIPGVTLAAKPVPVGHRTTLALGIVEEGWLSKRVLLDSATYSYVGEQSVAIKDHTSRGDDGTLHVRKGVIQLLAVRVAAKIVDRPGQR